MKNSIFKYVLPALIVCVSSKASFAFDWTVLNPDEWIRKIENVARKSAFSGFGMTSTEIESADRERIEEIMTKLLTGMQPEVAAVARSLSFEFITGEDYAAYPHGREILLLSTKLLELQDDEIAFIMAHEISHILNDDIHRAYMKHYWIPSTAILATTWYLGHFSWYWKLSRCKKVGMTLVNALSGTAAFVASSLSALETMRKSEFTADNFAMKTIRAAGFDPSVAIGWIRFKADQELWNFIPAAQLEFLETVSSHPTFAKRLANLE